MKILHIIYDDTENPWCGGGGALRAREVNEYLSDMNRITVFTGNFQGARNETVNGVTYVRIGSKSSYVISRICFTILVPFYIKRFKSDIVVNDCSYFAPCFASLYTKSPCLNIIHHLMGKHSFGLYSLLGLVPFTVEKLFLRTFKNILTPSKGVKREVQKRYPDKNVRNIPNGVSDALFDLVPEEKNFVLFLGRIDVYMKGLDILLGSFSLIRNRTLVLKMAGSGKKGDVRKVKKMISDLKLEKDVEFLGRVSEENKRELLRTCLFLVMPSRFEGWGITAIEANAAGKPVLGTKIEGLSEAVNNGQTALLVEPENREELASSIDYLVENHELRKSLGEQGRSWAKRLSWKAVAEEQFSFYRSVAMER
jgi:glycosyltransferase involved in cell wall biosynthesis